LLNAALDDQTAALVQEFSTQKVSKEQLLAVIRVIERDTHGHIQSFAPAREIGGLK
jgi:hypothetical protein